MAPPAPPREPLGPRFHHLLAFTGLSNLADGILLVGAPLYAITLTRAPGEIALLSAAVTAPWLFVALYAGLVVDRHDRPRIIAAATVVRALALVAATLAAVTGHLTLPLLVLTLLVHGCAEVFADTSSRALVPDVAPHGRLAAANSRLMGIEQLANAFLGGPVAGFVLALGAGWVFGLPAALATACLVIVLRGLWGKVPAPRTPDAAPTSRRSELKEGITYLRRHRVVRPLILGGTAFNFATSAYFAVFVLWVVGPGSAVGLPEKAYGLLMIGFAVGAISGAVLAERIVGEGRERRVIAATWGFGAVILVVPALVPNPWAIAAALTAAGFANMVGNVATSSLRQRLIPSRLLGRVSGASTTIAYGAMPLGALLGGLVAELLGLRALMLAVPGFLVVAVALTVAAFNQRDVAKADADADADRERMATITG